MTGRLVGFGYTERESEFLRLAALLSGYFLRRHFNEFIGKECGAVAQRFIDRGVGLKHFKPLSALSGRIIYHIGASQILRALEDPENRNRREHQADSIRRRLMALDFVLARPGSNWLLTEQEKVLFLSAAGVSDLPGVTFGGKTKRFFADKQPIAAGAGAGLQFGFIDEGWRTLSAWELFLKSHRAILQTLGAAEVVFASYEQSRFPAAERLFRTTIAGESSSGGVDQERLSKYFAARKLFEAKRYDSFDKSRLDQMREDKRVFAGEEFEQLYRRWHDTGESALFGIRTSRVRFSAQALPHLYEWLSPIRFQQRRG